jgi:hypothetical protein
VGPPRVAAPVVSAVPGLGAGVTQAQLASAPVESWACVRLLGVHERASVRHDNAVSALPLRSLMIGEPVLLPCHSLTTVTSPPRVFCQRLYSRRDLAAAVGRLM